MHNADRILDYDFDLNEFRGKPKHPPPKKESNEGLGRSISSPAYKALQFTVMGARVLAVCNRGYGPHPEAGLSVGE